MLITINIRNPISFTTCGGCGDSLSDLTKLKGLDIAICHLRTVHGVTIRDRAELELIKGKVTL